MKLGFSSIACPDWDLETIITQAAALGYDGVELRGLQGEMHLPASPALAQDPAAVARRFADAGVELVCLATGNCFHDPNRRRVAEQKAQVREFIELAAQLGCPMVRVFGDEVPRYDQKQAVALRIIDALRDLAPFAADHGVTLLLENHGDFVTSRDVWFIIDSVNHPAVKCCWHPCHARAGGDRMTLAIPRLGRMIGLVHLVDGRFSEDNTFEGYVLPGEGNLDVERFLNLLRGVVYQGYVVFDWPRLWVPSLAEPDKALPAAAEKIRGIFEAFRNEKELSAYKGDKSVPKYAALSPGSKT